MKLEAPKPTVTSIRFETGDSLFIRAITADAGEAFSLFYSFIADDGQLVSGQELISLPLAAQAFEFRFRMTGGYLLSLSMHAAATTNNTGCFATAARLRGDVNTTPNRQVFSSGFVTSDTPQIYPISPPVDLYQQHSAIRYGAYGSTGAGNEIDINLFADLCGEIQSAVIPFVASAAAANRLITFEYFSAIGVFVRIPGRTVITASQTRNIILWKGPNLPTDNTTDHFFPIPELNPFAAYTIRTVTANLQGGDDFQNGRLAFTIRPDEAVF